MWPNNHTTLSYAKQCAEYSTAEEKNVMMWN